MAQLGSALDWGSSGRRFKSCQPDHRKPALNSVGAGFLVQRSDGSFGQGQQCPEGITVGQASAEKRAASGAQIVALGVGVDR